MEENKFIVFSFLTGLSIGIYCGELEWEYRLSVTYGCVCECLGYITRVIGCLNNLCFNFTVCSFFYLKR